MSAIMMLQKMQNLQLRLNLLAGPHSNFCRMHPCFPCTNYVTVLPTNL